MRVGNVCGWLMRSMLFSRQALETDDRHIFFGEDIEDPKGGVFRPDLGARRSAYPDRVFNSPLAEATISRRRLRPGRLRQDVRSSNCNSSISRGQDWNQISHRISARFAGEPRRLDMSGRALRTLRCLLARWIDLAQSSKRIVVRSHPGPARRRPVDARRCGRSDVDGHESRGSDHLPDPQAHDASADGGRRNRRRYRLAKPAFARKDRRSHW